MSNPTLTATYHDQTVRLKEGVVQDLLESQSAAEMYWAYGAHVTDEQGNAVMLQAISAGELIDHDDDELMSPLPVGN